MASGERQCAGLTFCILTWAKSDFILTSSALSDLVCVLTSTHTQLMSGKDQGCSACVETANEMTEKARDRPAFLF